MFLMFVRELHWDEWNGRQLCEETIRDPSWPQIEDALRALDAAVRTIVTLQGSDGSQLVIGGGGGRYVVYLSTGDLTFATLATGAPATQKVVIDIGGQTGEFDPEICNELGPVLQAAKAFCGDGSADRSLQWRDR